MKQEQKLDAILFDWRGTLVHDPPNEWWVREALLRVGRVADEKRVVDFSDALRRAAELPEVVEGDLACDCSKEAHRAWSLMYFRLAGLDDELALALYALDLEATSHPFYPDSEPVVRALHERGCRIALVSNVHLDLRPEFAAAGFGDLIDTYVLSFEHGVQKPDRRIFEIALEALEVEPHRALMVGDCVALDGGAIDAGIATWLLPVGATAGEPRGLDRLLPLFV
ncbi:MAG TPA: HAD family hydrolase [Acidimicrobiia bacterium]|nr:HAD family hydrolase [Acidimicrobiia bacterium]